MVEVFGPMEAGAHVEVFLLVGINHPATALSRGSQAHSAPTDKLAQICCLTLYPMMSLAKIDHP